MNLKTIIIIGVGLLLALFGYNYYSSAKTAEKIAAYQAEAEKHKIEKEQIENRSKEDERLKKTSEAQQARDTSRSSNSSNAWSSRDAVQSRINQSYANASRNYEYKREELDVYRKMQSAASHMGTLIRTTSSTKGEDRDAIFERMSSVRSEVASIDTKNSNCAADSKTKLLTAIDTSIEGARAALNKGRDNGTKEMAVSKISIANETIQSCLSALR